MSKPTRKPDFASGSPTPTEKQALESLVIQWRTNAMMTEPVEHQQVASTIKALYSTCRMKEPRVIIASGPSVMLTAGYIAGRMLYQPENNKWDPGSDGLRRIANIERGEFLKSRQRWSYCHTEISNAIWEELDGHARRITQETLQAGDYNLISWEPDYPQLQAIYQQIQQVIKTASGRCSPLEAAAEHIDSIDALRTALSETYSDAAPYISRDNLYSLNHRDARFSHYKTYVRDGSFSVTSAILAQEAMQKVFGLTLHEDAARQAYIASSLASGLRIYHKDFCIVCDRPEYIHVDKNNRFHSADGPAIRWRDGSCLYFWHGIAIPPRLKHAIDAPQTISIQTIESEKNQEIRRILIERMGASTYIQACGAKIVDTLPDDHPIAGLRTARLLFKQYGWHPPMVFVDLLNSTPEPDGSQRRYLIRIDPYAYGGEATWNIHAAVASTWRDANDQLIFPDWRDYAPQFES
jgi:hypothetical protein